MRLSISPSRVLLYAILIIFAVVWLLPLYMSLITALKGADEINLTTAWLLPERVSGEGFREAVNLLGPSFMNSVILTVVATILSTVLGSLNGYVFAKWKFRGSEIIFTLFLFGMFIPYQIILIPLFQTLRAMNLYGGVPGLILAHVVYGLPITSLIFRNFYAQIPTALIESSQLDGAGFFSIYWKVIFPLSVPGFVVTALWQCTQIWNEFLWGVCLAPQAQPITVGLSNLAGGEAIKWNHAMAGALLAGIPVLIIYIILGRYFIRGLLAGSVKE